MPAVDRVIITLTNNPIYTGFWNYVSQIWAEKFHVKPTLMFYGTKRELDEFYVCRPRYNVFHVERVAAVTVNPTLDWGCTWSLFWGATLFPDEVCMLAGVDQVPLNGRIFDRIKATPRDAYTLGFGDAYGNPRTAVSTFPSSHHVALGSKFREVFGIDRNWETEVVKVFGHRHKYPLLPADFWGLDEAYSSEILRERIPGGDVAILEGFYHEYQTTRLWRGKDNLQNFPFEGVMAGQFSEWHADRPFENNNPELLNRLKDSIPEYTWT